MRERERKRKKKKEKRKKKKRRRCSLSHTLKAHHMSTTHSRVSRM
jgi:hypothetical protein